MTRRRKFKFNRATTLPVHPLIFLFFSCLSVLDSSGPVLSRSTPGPSSGSGHSSPSRPSASPQDPNNLPCLVVPPTLEFSSNPAQSNNHAILTIYNPYDFRCSFKILATNPLVYHVTPAMGDLPQRSSVKIIVKVKSSVANMTTANSLLENPQNPLSSNPLIPSHRHPSAPPPSASAAAPPPAPRAGDKFQVEIVDSKRGLTGKTIVDVKFSFQPVEQRNSAVPANPAISAQTEFSTNNRFPHTEPTIESPFANMSLPVRCLPLLSGILLISLLISGELQVGDSSATLWVAFFIGLVTMMIQMKFFESQ